MAGPCSRRRIMRWTMSLLGLLAVAGFSSAPMQEAAADGVKKRSVVRKHVQRERYSFDPDPYAYRYSPRGYYPYYNSSYWSSARYVRARNVAHYYDWIQDRPP